MQFWSNASQSGPEPGPDSRSRCVLGVAPVVYYTLLLCVGLPVNCVTLAALCRLTARSKSPLYWFLVSITAADILAQVCIVLVDFLLETAVFHRAVPPLVQRAVSAAEFGANHASIWAAVPLTVDRYVALCHPLLHRRLRSPSRTRRTIVVVMMLALASGVPFFYWPDLWRTQAPPSRRDAALIWSHVTIIYFLPCSIFLTLNARIIWTLRHRSRLRLELCSDLKLPLRTPSSPRPPAPGSTLSTCPVASVAPVAPGGPDSSRAPRSVALLLWLSGLFSLLWGPRVLALLLHLHVSTVNRSWRIHLLYDLSNMAAMLNTALNLLLYSATSRAIRSTAHSILCELLRGQPEGQPSRLNQDKQNQSRLRLELCSDLKLPLRTPSSPRPPAPGSTLSTCPVASVAPVAPGGPDSSRAPRSVALLLWLSGLFSLLWGPRVLALLLHLHVSTVNRSWRIHLLYDLSNMAAMLNTALNLLLYSATSRAIRSTAHSILCELLRGQPEGQPSRLNQV
ncbi:probable G-protein coupled receptor 142 [Eucyclogobius newberryi]|uniref:probable G-protein coupled receptor 142 n=1 Tax=Eucyclogobius newberryi TaxID=166745 RepID=UPI003B58D250